VVRSGSAGVLVLLALVLAGTARADADPASDVLYMRRVFLPFDTKIAPALVQRLADVTQAAEEAGGPVRVALIASPKDLGGIPALFGKPTAYARFLGAELQFVYLGQLLVVMPQGAALSQAGRLVANAAVVRAVIGSGGDGLARAAIDIVQTLTGVRAKPKPPPSGPADVPVIQTSGTPTSLATSRRSGTSVWVSAAIAVGAVCLLVAGGLVIVRRRRGRRIELAPPTQSPPPDPSDPYRYRGPG
jgi:hypothetical protein